MCLLPACGGDSGSGPTPVPTPAPTPAAAGTYTLIVGNLGAVDEAIATQVLLRPGAAGAAPPVRGASAFRGWVRRIPEPGTVSR